MFDWLAAVDRGCPASFAVFPLYRYDTPPPTGMDETVEELARENVLCVSGKCKKGDGHADRGCTI